jgi:hypothetical protein
MTPEPGMPNSIEIGGKSYAIRFSLGTLKTLQKEHGISLLKSGAADLIDPEKLAVVLYYGLRDRNPDVTLEWVEENVEASTLLSMIPSLGKAISGRTTTVPNEAALEALSGTGSPSGASGGTTSTLVNGRSGV